MSNDTGCRCGACEFDPETYSRHEEPRGRITESDRFWRPDTRARLYSLMALARRKVPWPSEMEVTHG